MRPIFKTNKPMASQQVKDLGNSALGLFTNLFTGAGNVLNAAGQNALTNVENNKATAAANRAAPDIIKDQIAAQKQAQDDQNKLYLYAGGGAAALIVVILVVIAIARRKT
jgi:hypothetical protein